MPKTKVLKCKVKPSKKLRKVHYEEPESSSEEYSNDAIEIEDRETGASYEVEKIIRNRNYYGSSNNNMIINDYLNTVHSNINTKNYSTFLKKDDYDLEALQNVDFSISEVINPGSNFNNDVAIAQIPVDEYSIKQIMQLLDNYKDKRDGKLSYIRILKILISSIHHKFKKTTKTIDLLKQHNVINTKIILDVTKKIRLLEKMINNPQPLKLTEGEIKNVIAASGMTPSQPMQLVEAISKLQSNS